MRTDQGWDSLIVLDDRHAETIRRITNGNTGWMNRRFFRMTAFMSESLQQIPL
jgi:hypothetical protein